MVNDILSVVEEKVARTERLTPNDALALYGVEDLLRLGQLADGVKKSRWGNHGYFILNRQINPSNICVLSCRFCDYATKRGNARAYEMTMDDILAKCAGVREVHLVSSLHPEWKFDHFEHMMRQISDTYPGIQIKGFTAVEIDYFAKKNRMTVEDVLTRFQRVGLCALPGGGAEVFSERVRKELFPFKMGFPSWAAIHKTAHRLGIPTNSTLLYGHIETLEERVDHFCKLRDIQDETGGFQSFIPLAYQVGPTSKVVRRQTSAIDDLKTMAIARLMLDNIPHIKAYWVTLGEETASMALHFGADDIDGTIGEEKIMHAADAESPLTLTRKRLTRLIEESGCVPVERDALYNVIDVPDPEAVPA